MKMRCQVRYMTLLETLVALSILSVLLTLSFGFFREMSHIADMTEKELQESFRFRYLESRLGSVFERVVNERDSTRVFYFFTEAPGVSGSQFPSLVFTFNNEVRQDPLFSGDVLGKISVNSKNELILAVWPLVEANPQAHLHEEVLLDGVKALKFDFYAPPERGIEGRSLVVGSVVDPGKTVPRKNEWQEEWPLAYKQMPSIVKIELEREEKGSKNNTSFLFRFVLPSSKNPVHLFAPMESASSQGTP